MVTSPNQKIIHIIKAPRGHRFLQINIEVINAAARVLNFTEFRIFIYLAENASDYDLALSQADIEKEMGVTHTPYYKAINSLIDKGYLVNVQGNVYNFFEQPVPKKEVISLIGTEQKAPVEEPINTKDWREF